MLTDKRNETQQETVLDGRDEPLLSRDELIQQCHRALSAHLWTTCCWSEDGFGWKVGDFNSLVVSVAPDADTSLYDAVLVRAARARVDRSQFGRMRADYEPVYTRVTPEDFAKGGPGVIRYIGPAERHALEARGYTLGGRARNYLKELVIDSVPAAEAAALDMLHIFFEVFGYRGHPNTHAARDQRRRHGRLACAVAPALDQELARM